MKISVRMNHTITPSWVRSQALAMPDSTYTWDLGVSRTMTSRARTLKARMIDAGIPATLTRDNTHAPGLWKLTFPILRYRECAAISEACRIGDAGGVA